MQTKIEDRAVRRSPFTRRAPVICLCAIALLLVRVDPLRAQGKAQLASDTEAGAPEKPADLERRVETLEAEVAELKRLLTANASAPSPNACHASAALRNFGIACVGHLQAIHCCGGRNGSQNFRSVFNGSNIRR